MKSDIALLHAPWTDKQVETLQEFQENDNNHPYTCGYCCESLTPYSNGWECEYCHQWHQDWCLVGHVTLPKEVTENKVHFIEAIYTKEDLAAARREGAMEMLDFLIGRYKFWIVTEYQSKIIEDLEKIKLSCEKEAGDG